MHSHAATSASSKVSNIGSMHPVHLGRRLRLGLGLGLGLGLHVDGLIRLLLFLRNTDDRIERLLAALPCELPGRVEGVNVHARARAACLQASGTRTDFKFGRSLALAL